MKTRRIRNRNAKQGREVKVKKTWEERNGGDLPMWQECLSYTCVFLDSFGIILITMVKYLTETS